MPELKLRQWSEWCWLLRPRSATRRDLKDLQLGLCPLGLHERYLDSLPCRHEGRQRNI